MYLILRDFVRDSGNFCGFYMLLWIFMGFYGNIFFFVKGLSTRPYWIFYDNFSTVICVKYGNLCYFTCCGLMKYDTQLVWKSSYFQSKMRASALGEKMW